MFFWLMFGGIIAVIDCWLSIQSMFGILHPFDFLSYSVAIIVGISLTAIAVLAPIIRDHTTAPIWKFLWFIVLLVDIGTSILGAIWYGVMRNPINSKIDISEIGYDPNNSPETAVYIAFVLIVAYCCVKFGQALNRLNKRYLRWRERQDIRLPY
ncbi:MAG: hypothetical protein ACT4NY_27590 [Pseudonocardiales bacterium]